MSEQHDESTVPGSGAQTTKAQTEAPRAEGAPPDAAAPSQLADLMAAAAQQHKGAPKVDLDLEALKAAEQALATGQKALEQAKTELGVATKKQRSTRELVLRGLLVVNVVAMLVVAWLPPAGGAATTTTPSPTTQQPQDPHAVEPTPPPVAQRGHEPTPVPTTGNDPWTEALRAADRQDWAGAIRLLEQHLQDSPRMAPSQKLSVLMALGYYSSRTNDFAAAREYQRKADAIEQSHSLPEDLVAMAKAAADAGDQEALRRIWARFLLQQKQIPSWLYKHVAEAYLQLGDSYRNAAETAAERQRIEELNALAAKLRPQEAK